MECRDTLKNQQQQVTSLSNNSSSSISLDSIHIKIYPSLKDQTIPYIAQIQFSLIESHSPSSFPQCHSTRDRDTSSSYTISNIHSLLSNFCRSHFSFHKAWLIPTSTAASSRCTEGGGSDYCHTEGGRRTES